VIILGGKGSGAKKGFKSPWTRKRNLENNPCKKGMHLGKKNPMWKGGISKNFYLTTFAYLKKDCFVCGSKKNLEFHHLDRNQKNNSIDNLMILCRLCHKQQHAQFRKKQKEKRCCTYCSITYFPRWKKRNIKFCSRACYTLSRVDLK